MIDKRKLKYSLNHIIDENFKEDEGFNALPLYFGLLIIIVLVIIMYFILQLRIKHNVKSAANLKSSQQTFKYPVNYHNIYNNSKGFYSQNAKHYNFNQFVKTSKASVDCEKLNEKATNCLIVKRYNELNTSVRRAFEINLNNKTKSWKSLAKELGYTDASISIFESLGRQRMNCVQYFLTDWSKYEDSTINSLIKALHKIGRIDCIIIIDPSFRVSPY
ncbi:unnamed protein product [Medioppia subpectinata]|uniref:Death domain-containing protein n=1 Tax=Medioppia subpectinata TaxID=1979941 RepID=A0A7R9KB88_9ACAR|nr:unnamed protein product [Medioppia subpectinata]CAG2100270.1 unnamed protein product [Medioppia subpectinata]